MLSNGEVKELQFKELVDEMSRPKSDLSTRPGTPPEISIGTFGGSYSNFEQFRSRRHATRTDEEATEVKEPLLTDLSGVYRPTALFSGPTENGSTTAHPGPSSHPPRPPLRRIPTIGLDRKYAPF